LPIAAAIVLAIIALGALIVVLLTAWRLLASVRELAASVANMSRQLGPALEALNSQAAETSARAARLDETVSGLDAPFQPASPPRGRGRREARRPPGAPNRSRSRGVD
jgi:hypothetical protein